MSWPSTISHLVVFSLLLLPRSRKYRNRFTAEDLIPLVLTGLILFLCDLGEFIPYDSLIRLFPEEGVIETSQIILEIICFGSLLFACLFCRSNLQRAGYLLYAFTFLLIVLEEISYGADYFHISDPGPIVKALMTFKHTYNMSALGLWAPILWFFRNCMDILLPLTTILILLSPDLSLGIFLRPRTLLRALRLKYVGPGGAAVLLSRLALPLLFSVIRTLIPSMTGFIEEKQVDELAFLLCSTAYCAGIVVPRVARTRTKNPNPAWRMHTIQPVIRIALPPILAGWMVFLLIGALTPRLRSIPANILPIDSRSQACAREVLLEKVLVYTKGEEIVVEGLARNVGSRDIDVRAIRYDLFGATGKILFSGTVDPFGKFTGAPLPLFPRAPLEPGKRQFFHAVIDRQQSPARIGLQIAACAYDGD
ncbi:hypothetical protein ACFL4G_04850 [Thermodesulfobacteriota bacterium]